MFVLWFSGLHPRGRGSVYPCSSMLGDDAEDDALHDVYADEDDASHDAEGGKEANKSISV